MKELKLAKKAAKKAGKILQAYRGKDFQVRHKGEIDLVTEVDLLSQNKICELIRKHFPEDAILAEEAELASTENARRRWIIDPIDGTTNFAHGYPIYCISIAFEEDQEVKCGVIYDPTRDELFWARKGHGAFLGKKEIRVSKTKTLSESLLVTGFPYHLEDERTNNLNLFSKMMFRCQAVRRDGSAALNLAYVAAGYFDGFWELGLKAWDSAAGVLMIREAGGDIKCLRAAENSDYPESFCAGNQEILPSLFDELT